MIEKRINKIRAKICEKLRARFEQIFPVAKQGLFNFRCFENSVQFAKDSQKELKIFEVMYIDGEHPILHYLVKDENEFQEVTIGWRTEHVDFFLIREVPKSDWNSIGAVFNASLEYWCNDNTGWFDRAILGIDRVC